MGSKRRNSRSGRWKSHWPPIAGLPCLGHRSNVMWVGLTLESMSSTTIFGRCRSCTGSIRCPQSKTVGAVHVLLATEASEDGLAKQARHRVLTVWQCADHQGGQTGDIAEFAEGEQAGIRRDTGAVELQLLAAVEIQPARSRIHQPGSPCAASCNVSLILTAESAPIRINDWSYTENAS
jgi:hypothetical protein